VEYRTRAFLEVIRLCSFVIIISFFVHLREKVISVTENPRTVKCDCSKMVGEVSFTDLLKSKSCPTRRINGPIRYLLRRICHLKLEVLLPEFHRLPPKETNLIRRGFPVCPEIRDPKHGCTTAPLYLAYRTGC
jgi:hypothetical protein